MPSKKLRETLEQLQSFSEPSKHAQIFRALFGPSRFYEPRTYQEALASEDRKKWITSMADEHSSLKENNTWVEIETDHVPQGKQILPGRWIYKRKGDGRFKSRWVVQGFRQRPGIDYDETYASVAEASSHKLIYAISVLNAWYIRQADFKTAFLNSEIDCEIYIQLPKGFEKPDTVGLLNKSLYGLKQAPKIWWNLITEQLVKLGLRCSTFDPCVFIGEEILVGLHVDDIQLAGKSLSRINSVLDGLANSFEMTMMGEPKKFLGIEIEYDQTGRRMHLCQERHIQDLLIHFGMQDCNAATTPMVPTERLDSATPGEPLDEQEAKMYQSGVGSLNFLCTMTRPDIAFPLSVISKFNADPRERHMQALKRILRYLKGTADLGITYSAEGGTAQHLHAYSDSDFAGTIVSEDRRSTGAFITLLANGPISWRSRRQTTIAVSSTQAEYTAQFEAMKETVGLRNQLAEILQLQDKLEPSLLYADNTQAITQAQKPAVERKAKHWDIPLHKQREFVEQKQI